MRYARMARQSSGSFVLTLALLCAFFGGISGGVLGFNMGRQTQATAQLEPATLQQAGQTQTCSPSQIYLAAAQGVVSIQATGADGRQNQISNDSGFFVSTDGDLLTSYHVVENMPDILVVLDSGQSYPAELVQADPVQDLALLKISGQQTTPLWLNLEQTPQVGEQVCAIGNPMGELPQSLTVGYLSALQRQVQTDDGKVMTMLQTDCAINSGNSGGPLLDSQGRVIGVVSARYRDTAAENIGFAIPISCAGELLAQLPDAASLPE